MQTAKVIAVVYFVFAIMFAVAFAAIALFYGYPRRAMMAMIGIPISYGALSFIGTIVICLVYNEVARRSGGIEFEVTPKSAN
jgi:hypothetical protein